MVALIYNSSVGEAKTGGSLPGLGGPQLSLIIASSCGSERSNLKNINILTTPEAELWLLHIQKKIKNKNPRTHTQRERETYAGMHTQIY